MQPAAAGRALPGLPARHGTRGGQPSESAASGEGVSPIEKGLVSLRGEPLVAHARRFLAGQVNQVEVSANRRIEAYARIARCLLTTPK